MARPAFDLSTDPNVTLANLRAAIERRLRIMAKGKGITSVGSAYEIVELLVARDVLRREAADSLLSILLLADRAAHGSKVPPETLGVLHQRGPDLIHALDSLISQELSSLVEHFSPGTEVVVPWEWTDTTGTVIELRGEGPMARVLVDVDIPGTPGSEKIEFPAAALRPA